MMQEDPYAYVEAALQASPSPDYVPGPEEPEQAPPLPDFVLGPEYPGYLAPADDEIIAKDHPYADDASPTSDSPGYIAESDLEEDPNEEGDEDPEEDPADYPTDRDDEEEEEESLGDDANDEEEDEDEDEEEEEHPASADFVLSLACRTTTRMSIQAQTPTLFLSEVEIDRLLAIPTPPPSPLTSYSSPLPQISSPPLPASPPLPISPSPLPASPTHPLGYKAAMIRLRAESPSTSHPLPPPLLLPSTDHRADVPKVTLPPQKRLCIVLDPIFEVRESSSAATARPTRGFRVDYGFIATLDADIRCDMDREIGYGITDVLEDPDEIIEDILATDVAELSQRMTDFVTIASHARMTRLMKQEAKVSRVAWARSMDGSDTARSEVRALRSTVLAQQDEIAEFRAADRRRQRQLIDALTLLKSLQTQMAAFQRQ
ncbi:hypothetical protein Tco_0925312 [Tanacetum coccineum]|uniref:Uncharacterized protein n=1 Tax=Tanacetum coccineum TaxID=301880 RepID=A0ABQ5D8I4_9ASTR